MIQNFMKELINTMVPRNNAKRG